MRGDDESGFASAVTAARGSDAAIIVVGGRSGLTVGCTSGEAVDRAEVTLSGVQLPRNLSSAVLASPKGVTSGISLLLMGFSENPCP